MVRRLGQAFWAYAGEDGGAGIQCQQHFSKKNHRWRPVVAQEEPTTILPIFLPIFGRTDESLQRKIFIMQDFLRVGTVPANYIYTTA